MKNRLMRKVGANKALVLLSVGYVGSLNIVTGKTDAHAFTHSAFRAVSPNGQIFLVRSILEDESGDEFSALIFFDGRSRKVVETDSWLKELMSEPVRQPVPPSEKCIRYGKKNRI